VPELKSPEEVILREAGRGTQTHQGGGSEADVVAEVEAEYAAWLAATERTSAVPGAGPDVPRHVQARELLESIDARIEARKHQIEAAENAMARTGFRGGPTMARIRRLHREIETLDSQAARLWSEVHPVEGLGPQLVQCRSEGCLNCFPSGEEFGRTGFCEPCWAVATGQAPPAFLHDDLARAVSHALGERTD
jgi:hypothetical protein